MEGKPVNQGEAKLLLSVDEVGHLLGIAPKTIYNGIGRKAKSQFPVKHFKVGRLVKFKRADVEAYVEGLK